MSNRVMVFSSGDMMYNNRYIYTASYVDGGVTIVTNMLADGDDNGKPYKLSGSRHVYLKDPNGNEFTGAVRKQGSRSLMVNPTTHAICTSPEPPPTPVELPAYTLRFRFSNSSYNPTTATDHSGFNFKSGHTWTQVTDSDYNDWDYTRANANWDDEFNGIFTNSNNLVDIIAAGDMSGVTSMKNVKYLSSKVDGGTFGSGSKNKSCSIRSICTFDASNISSMDGLCFHCVYMKKAPELDYHNITSFWSAFDSCTGLTYVNRMDFSSATSLRAIFANCNLKQLPDMSTVTSRLNLCQYAFQGNANCGINGSPGILDAYNYLSAANPGTKNACFSHTGENTTAGRAELSQVPNNWKS